MNEFIPATTISPLRQRLIDDMTMRRFSPETQRNYVRDVGRFATFLGRRPDTATAEDLRRFQIEQRDGGVPTPTMNSIVSALRFFFTHTIDRPDLATISEKGNRGRGMSQVLSLPRSQSDPGVPRQDEPKRYAGGEPESEHRV